MSTLKMLSFISVKGEGSKRHNDCRVLSLTNICSQSEKLKLVEFLKIFEIIFWMKVPFDIISHESSSSIISAVFGNKHSLVQNDSVNSFQVSIIIMKGWFKHVIQRKLLGYIRHIAAAARKKQQSFRLIPLRRSTSLGWRNPVENHRRLITSTPSTCMMSVRGEKPFEKRTPTSPWHLCKLLWLRSPISPSTLSPFSNISYKFNHLALVASNGVP